MALQLERRLFTVDEYHKMLAAGILKEDDRVELIEGEIVQMSPIGKHHAGIVNRLAAILHNLFADSAVVAVQNPIQIGDSSEPEPDIAILNFRGDYYAGKLPTPQDIVFLIEVAETTLATDRGTKVPLYAHAGIPEVWIVNLSDELVEVYSSPSQGAYRQTGLARRRESLAVPGLPGAHLAVEEILGEPL
jgi:Uma2 family endonuclease